MKNALTVLVIILLVAVAGLYVLYFAGGSSSGGSGLGEIGGISVEDARIAYVNGDSLLENYEYLTETRKVLEAKRAQMDQDYRNRVESLQSEYENYQRNMGNLTISQARALEEDLTRKQQNLRVYEQTLTQQLMTEQEELNIELYTRVTDFLKKFGEENNLHLVLKYDISSDVLYAGKTLDITAAVLAGLNEEYKRESGKATTPADSVAP